MKKKNHWGRRYTTAQKQAVMQRVTDGVKSGLTWSESCRQAEIGNATAIKFAADLGLPATRRHCETRVKAAPYSMKADSFRSSESFLLLFGHLANRLAEDIGHGLVNGWLDNDLHATRKGGARLNCNAVPTPEEASEAVDWLRSAEAVTLCSLINMVVGSEFLSPARIERMARRKAEELEAIGDRAFGGNGRRRTAITTSSALAA